MPDLFTHTIAAVPLSWISRRKLPALMVLVGGIFPDLVSRTILILAPQNYPLFWVAVAWHTPIVILLSAYLTSLFFTQPERKSVFWALVIGSAVHLVLDSAQKHHTGGHYWFFPFSYAVYELDLFWFEDLVGWILSATRYISPQ